MRPSKLKLTALVAGLFSLSVAGLAFSDADDDQDDGNDHPGWFAPRADIAPVRNPGYQEECSACHMAYQPGLLPAQSWRRIMAANALLDHFGDDASLPEGRRVEIAAWLEANAADRAERSRSRAFAVAPGVGGSLPRISTTRYFQREHHEIPDRLVRGNPGVGSFSNCDACHRGALDGVYNEHRVLIPGVGRWED